MRRVNGLHFNRLGNVSLAKYSAKKRVGQHKPDTTTHTINVMVSSSATRVKQ